MRASVVMALAVVMYVIVRWSRNEPAVTLAGVLSGVFVIFVIALLDHGKTESVARGFAWLFFIVAAYNAIPVLAKASKSSGKNGLAQVKNTVGPNPVGGGTNA